MSPEVEKRLDELAAQGAAAGKAAGELVELIAFYKALELGACPRLVYGSKELREAPPFLSDPETSGACRSWLLQEIEAARSKLAALPWPGVMG